MRRKLFRIFLVFLVALACLFGYVAWRSSQPRFVVASEAEVRALFDPRLMEPVPINPEAQIRYERLAEVVMQEKVDDAVKRRQAIRVIDSGPLEEPVKKRYSMPEVQPIMALINTSVDEAERYAEKDPARAFVALTDSIRLRSAYAGAFRNLLTFNIVTRNHSDLSATVKMLPYLTRTQAQGFARILDADPDWSGYLRKTTRCDAQMAIPGIATFWLFENVKRLPEYEPMQVGTYDAIATGKISNIVDVTLFDGAGKPVNQVDTSIDGRVDRLKAAFPSAVDYQRLPEGFLRNIETRFYNMRLNNIENSQGINNGWTKTGVLLGQIANNRNERHMQRIAVAIRMYELEHRKMPTSLEELISTGFLPKAPLDAVTGKPVTFDSATGAITSATTRIVYEGLGTRRFGDGAFP